MDRVPQIRIRSGLPTNLPGLSPNAGVLPGTELQKRVFVGAGTLLLHPRGPVSHDGDRIQSVQAWRQREDSLTVGGKVVPVAVPVQQRSELRMHLNGLKLSAFEDTREVSFFSGVLWSTSPHTSC